MSEDNKNFDPFDFDFDVLNEESPAKSADGSLNFDNPFGDDSAFSGSEAAVNADNPFFSEAPAVVAEPDDAGADVSAAEPAVSPDSDKKKKGFFGRSDSGKSKPKKEKKVKEKAVKPVKEPKETLPRDWGTVLCVVFSAFLLVSLLTFNIAAFLSRGPESTIMQTLCFLGAFNLVGLAAASVPILFYKYPQERTAPNVLLGVAAVAMFIGVLAHVNEFYRYSFIMTP